jgi:hypothetical protein
MVAIFDRHPKSTKVPANWVQKDRCHATQGRVLQASIFSILPDRRNPAYPLDWSFNTLDWTGEKWHF